MRTAAIIGLLSLCPVPAGAVQQGAQCESALWHLVEGRAAPGSNFAEIVAFLRNQSLHYRVLDARAPINFVDDQMVFNPQLYDAGDCIPQEEALNCTIVINERMPEDGSAFASLPAIVIAEEMTVIDFDADGTLIGARCEIVLTGP